MGSKAMLRPFVIDTSYKDFNGLIQSPNPLVYYIGMTRNASDNPKFKDIIKSGGNATNSMTVEIRRASFSPMRLGLKSINIYQPAIYGKTIEVHDSTVAADKLIVSTFEDAVDHLSVDNKALIGIIKKIRECQTSGFSGPAFLVELKQTIGMIREPFKAIRNKTGLLVDLHTRIKRDRKIKRDKFKESDWASIISGTYMEWVFGVKPLVGDIASVLKAAAHSIPQAPSIARLSHKYTDATSKDDVLSYSPTGVVGVVFTNRSRTNRYSQMYTVGLSQEYRTLDTISDKVHNILNLSRFDLGEILPAAWEGIPWSWAVDYVTNIGDLLACTYDYNQRVRWAKSVSKDSLLCSFTGQSYRNDSPYIEVLGMISEKFSTEYTVFDRRSMGSLGFPKFEWSLPSFNQANNLLQVIITIKGKP